MSDGALGRTQTATRTCTPRLDALRSWLAANNVRVSPKLEIRAVQSSSSSSSNEATEARQQKDQNEEDSFAVYALNDVRHDEILAVTPRSAILSRRTCSLAQSPAFHRLCAQVEGASPQQAGVRILAIVVTHEMLLGDASKWYGYLLSMPQSCAEVGLPTFWEDKAALSWLQGTDVLTYMEQQQCTKQQVDTFYSQVVVPFLQATLPAKKILQETFNLAFSLVLSRAFYVDNYHDLSMVPLADAFNHHFAPQATLQSDDIVCPTCGSRNACAHDDGQDLSLASQDQSRLSTDGSGIEENMADLRLKQVLEEDAVEMIATDDVVKGQEVFNTYGKLDNASLLANYGFIIEANEDDKVRWFSVASVLRQAKSNDEKMHLALINETWRSAIRNMSKPLREMQDERVSTEIVKHPHLRQAHELLFIDADGAVSVCLLMLLDVIRQSPAGSGVAAEESSSAAHSAKLLETLLRSRLQVLAVHGPSTDELFDIVSEARTSLPAKLAISRVIDERLLLSACLAQWSEDGGSRELEE